MDIWKKLGDKPVNKELCLQYDNQIGETTDIPDMIELAQMVIAKAKEIDWSKDKIFDCKDFLNILNQIYVTNGYKLLGVNLLNYYVLKIVDKECPLSNVSFTFELDSLYNNLIVADSIMGAWQFYFLTFLDTVLPLSGHGNYNRREFIFTPEDIKHIGIYEKSDQSVRNILLNCDIKPKIVHMNGKYYLSICFWNEWLGLLRELCEIEIVDNKARYDNIAFKSLYEYNCGYIL